jgi:hypothetical protein
MIQMRIELSVEFFEPAIINVWINVWINQMMPAQEAAENTALGRCRFASHSEGSARLSRSSSGL